MGAGGNQAAAIVLRVPRPPAPPWPRPPPPPGPPRGGHPGAGPPRPPEPTASANKGAATPRRHDPFPHLRPFQSPPAARPALSAFNPIPCGRAQRGHLWRSWTASSIPAPPCRSSRQGGFTRRSRTGSRGWGSTSWCGETCCRRGRRASRNWKARSRESQT